MVRHHRNPLVSKRQKYSLPVLSVVIVLLALGGLYLVFRSRAASTNADVNGDGVVDIKDLSVVASHYGQMGLTFAQGDISGDGQVDVTDLSILASHYGQSVGGNPNPIQVSQLPALLGNYATEFGPSNSFISCEDQLTSAYDPSIQAWRQYMAYSGVDRQPYITTRILPDGNWQTPVNIFAAMGSITTGLDGHDCLVTALDAEGYIHITGNPHLNPLQMAQSSAPYSIGSFINIPVLVDKATESEVAYPNFFKTNDGTLMLAYATGHPGNWYLDRWDTSSGNPGHWVRVIELADDEGIDDIFYPWRFVVDRSNTATRGRIHFFGTWRVGGTGSGIASNEDLLDYYSDDNGVTWYQYGNTNPIHFPIVHSAEGSKIIDTDFSGPKNRFIRNAGGLDIDQQGHLHALVVMSTQAGTDVPRLYHVWYDGNQWHLDSLNSLGQKPRSSVFTDNTGKTWGFLSPTTNNQLLVLNLTPGTPGYGTKTFVVAQDLNFGAMSAIFDTSLLNGQNQLSFMFTQLGGAQPSIQPDANYQQPAYVETIPIDKFDILAAGGVTIPHLVSQDTQTAGTKTVSGDVLQKLLTTATVSSAQPLYVRLTATARTTADTTVTLKAIKSSLLGDVAFGSLSFNAPTTTTKSTPWLPVQLGTNYSGVLSAAAQITAGSGSGTIDSLTLQVSSLVYPTDN